MPLEVEVTSLNIHFPLPLGPKIFIKKRLNKFLNMKTMAIAYGSDCGCGIYIVDRQ